MSSGVRREPSRSVPAILAQGTRVGLRLQSAGLDQLLPVECTLLTCILDLVAALGALRCRHATQLTIFGPAQIALSAQLLTRALLVLWLRLQISARLAGRLSLLAQGALLTELLALLL